MTTANAARPAADPDAIDRLVGLGLTPRQAEVFLYIFNCAMERGYQLSYRDLMIYMGVRSLNAVKLYVNGLERAGFVKRNGSGNRNLRLLKTHSGAPFRGFVLREDRP